MSVVVTDRQPERKRKEKESSEPRDSDDSFLSQKKSVILVKVVGRFLC